MECEDIEIDEKFVIDDNLDTSDTVDDERIEKCIIDDILNRPFASRTMEEQMALVKMQVPQPDMKRLVTVIRKKNVLTTRRFYGKAYEVKWVCGSEKLQKLFCWPCLLFTKPGDKGVWNKKGYSDVIHISASIKAHSSSKDHIENALSLQTFGKQGVEEESDHENENQEKQQFNATVQKNRTGMKSLIEVACFLGSRGWSLESGNFQDMCSLLASKDESFQQFLSSNKIFAGPCSTNIQEELISAIGKAMMQEIKAQIVKKEFVSVIVDEVKDASQNSKLIITLRYCTENGSVVERFVDYLDVSQDATAQTLSVQIAQIIRGCAIATPKLVAQTYDGASVLSDDNGELQEILVKVFPNADFVHSRNHELNLVLIKSCSANITVKKFFSNISSLKFFFTESPKRNVRLKEFLNKKLPKLSTMTWTFTSRMMNDIQEFYAKIITCLGEIYSGELNWNGETICTARGLHGFLLEFPTVFLLKLFSQIFSNMDTLYEILQTNEMDISRCDESVEEAKHCMKALRKSENCEFLIEKTISTIGQLTHPGDKTTCVKLFNDTLQLVAEQLDKRFEDLLNFSYFSLLNCKRFRVFGKCSPKDAIEKLCEKFSLFDKFRLTNELRVLYQKLEFRNKTAAQIIQYLTKSDLADVFAEVFNLAKLIVTIPSTSVSVDEALSVSQRVESFFSTTSQEEKTKDLMLMAVEKQLLNDMQSTSKFIDRVIELFVDASQNMIPLTFK
ncbi:uncharacterized protein LOC129751357 [Uranotaenia lowii]|uniref:uncharacterized protein LOC129751357 n=1 Tax=Uranotaenia lowii TaxID=190385 RepID=UPI00247A5272|nr:uncharacterized protein LOC129751357 [Uranotaenia lowii]